MVSQGERVQSASVRTELKGTIEREEETRKSTLRYSFHSAVCAASTEATVWQVRPSSSLPLANKIYGEEEPSVVRLYGGFVSFLGVIIFIDCYDQNTRLSHQSTPFKQLGEEISPWNSACFSEVDATLGSCPLFSALFGCSSPIIRIKIAVFRWKKQAIPGFQRWWMPSRRKGGDEEQHLFMTEKQPIVGS
ncbi:hypothetical protein MUK42_37031 [Musa troglodytarum]|uniref:Uncharacterized protein n=1 Tax=Musa troglodytarum TaxID=320322 RepID=A0A9E7ECE0_9LILI|nr:hypothetical protein MUK42_37031 [Musa troglodytarum]